MLFFLFDLNFSQVFKSIDGNMGINVVINKKKFKSCERHVLFLVVQTTISLCSIWTNLQQMHTWNLEGFNNGLNFYEIIFFATSMMGNLETWISHP